MRTKEANSGDTLRSTVSVTRCFVSAILPTSRPACETAVASPWDGDFSERPLNRASNLSFEASFPNDASAANFQRAWFREFRREIALYTLHMAAVLVSANNIAYHLSSNAFWSTLPVVVAYVVSLLLLPPRLRQLLGGPLPHVRGGLGGLEGPPGGAGLPCRLKGGIAVLRLSTQSAPFSFKNVLFDVRNN